MLLRSRTALFARRPARVEIIPLIDVVFFLLATFVLFTLALNRIQSLRANLPVGGEPKGKPEAVSLQVTDGGAVYWDQEPVARTELAGRLAHYKAQTDSPRVVVSGDDRARFGPLVAVLDDVRRAGITQYAVETRPRPTGK